MKRFFLITLMMAFAFVAKANPSDPGRLVGTHWSFQTNYEFNITITGVITIDGESLQSSPRSAELEIGAFCGDECRGSFLADHVTLPFFNGYAYQMQVYSNVASGDVITFRVWDHEAEAELDVTCQSVITFVSNDSYGNLRNPYQFLFISNHAITATANPTDGGSVTGTGSYMNGTTCTLTATANEGYTFTNWTKDGEVVSTEPEYTFTVTEPSTFVANFQLNSYEITVSANPAEGGTVDGAGTYNHFATCMLTATANENYTFVNWTKDGIVVSTDASYSFTVTEAAAYVANFQSNGYIITATANPSGGGTITGAGVFQEGETCTLTATANEGYTFINWTKDGVVVTTENTYSFVVTEAAAFIANFQVNSYEITASVNPTEGGTVTGAGTYDYGTNITLTATANEGYTFVNWTKNGEVVSTEPAYTFTVTGAAAFIANFQINSYEITASANPTEGGTVTGGGTFNHFETCTLTATANQGYTFINWTKNGEAVSTEATYSFTVTEAATFVANFQINSYEITATANPTEGGSITGAGTYNYGTTVTLTATANQGYTFINWTKDGEVVTSEDTYTFTVSEDAAYVANFQINSYEITATTNPTEGGSITGAGTYNYGTTCTLTATANEGYTFSNWTLNGDEVSTETTYSFTVTEDAAFVANFTLNSYEITVSANPTEGGIVSGEGTYNHGETVTLTATANEGYSFVNWTKDGEVISNEATYSFTITEAAAYVANFQLNSYEVTAIANPTEGGIITGAGTYNHFETCTLTATANEGYTFINWTKDGEVVTTENTYSFIVTEAADFVANFQINSYEITVSVNPEEGGSASGEGTYDYGTTCTLIATPNVGYTFVNWTKDGEVVSEEATYSFTITGDASFVANFTISSYEITVTAYPADGGIVTGAGTYLHGTTVTLTATANEEFTFLYWAKDGEVVTTETTYSFIATETATYIATFQPNGYAINATANPTEGGIITGMGVFQEGETCTLTATANEGYTFINWTKDGEVVTTETTYSFVVTEPADFVANFQINSYEITTLANPTEGGTVTGEGTYNHFAICSLTATANEGYTFINWTKDGEVVSTEPEYSFTVTEAATFVAHFSLNSYEITASANPSEGGVVTGAATYNHFETCTLTATANEGYTFINWTKDDEVVSTNAVYSFTVTEAAAFVANFQLNSYEITASANPTAGGIITGAGTYNHFETCTLTATANEGYAFINWTKDGVVVSTEAAYSFTVTEAATFVAHFQLNSYEITASANPTAGGIITGAGTYNHFETCTLTATANEGYTFVNWIKDGELVTTDPTFSFTVTEDATFVANFQINSYEITASAEPAEGGTVSGAGTYNYGQTCTLTAIPSTDYMFINWTKDGVEVSTNASYSFTVTEDASYVAHFSDATYIITAVANPTAGGQVSGGGSFAYGQTCTLSATANTGYTFLRWTRNGEIVSTTGTFSFTVTESADYVAHFRLNTYYIGVSADPAEGGNVTGEGYYTLGQNCNLTATPNNGYTFVNWTKNGVVVSASPTYSFNVTGDAIYVAHFSQNTFTITVVADPTSGGQVSGGGTYAWNQSCTLTASANPGYTFVNWTKNGVVVTNSLSFSFNVTENGTYVAHFTQDMYTITASADPTSGGHVAGGSNFFYGETCNLVATANYGYSFVNWTKNGIVVSSSATYSFTVTETAHYVAHFTANSFAVTLGVTPANGGQASGEGSYQYGESCTVTATPNEGYTFVKWTKNGMLVSTNPTYTFTVTENAHCTAYFALQTFNITASVSPTEGGEITGEGTYNYGEIATLNVTPNANYFFVNWTENGQVVSENESYSFVVTGDRDLVANLYYYDGLNENGEVSISIYPNPTSEKLTIEASEAVNQCEIFSITGALIYTQKNCSDVFEIQVSDLPVGNYLIRLTTQSSTSTRSFMKQ